MNICEFLASVLTQVEAVTVHDISGYLHSIPDIADDEQFRVRGQLSEQTLRLAVVSHRLRQEHDKLMEASPDALHSLFMSKEQRDLLAAEHMLLHTKILMVDEMLKYAFIQEFPPTAGSKGAAINCKGEMVERINPDSAESGPTIIVVVGGRTETD